MNLRMFSPHSMGLSCNISIPFLSPILMFPLGGGDLDRLLFKEEKESVASFVISKNGWRHYAMPFFDERVFSFSHCFVELDIHD